MSSSSYSVAPSIYSTSTSGGSSVVSAWTQRRRKQRRYKQKMSSIIKCMSYVLIVVWMGNTTYNYYFLLMQEQQQYNTNDTSLSSSSSSSTSTTVSWNTLFNMNMQSPNFTTILTTTTKKKKPTTLLDFISNKTWHPLTRRERFPSIQERVQLYMSIWYQPHDCPFSAVKKKKKNDDNDDLYLQGKTYHGGGIVELDIPLWLQSNTCSSYLRTHLIQSAVSIVGRTTNHNNNDDKKNNLLLHSYCQAIQRDAAILFSEDSSTTTSTTSSSNMGSSSIPILVQFSSHNNNNKEEEEVDTSNGVPILTKWRTSTDKLPPLVDDPTLCQIPHFSGKVYPGILWPFSSFHHHPRTNKNNNMERLLLRADTIPWDQKIPKAVVSSDYDSFHNDGLPTEDNDDDETATAAATTISLLNNTTTNDQLQKRSNNSTNVNDDFIIIIMDYHRDSSKKTKKIHDSLRYQILVSLHHPEEEDADDLIWKLASSSVVVMPIPTRTSWLMEELLIPWVHYIPLRLLDNNDDSNNVTTTTTTTTTNTDILLRTTNIQEQIQWIRHHQEESQKIAERATLFIYDVWYHPDSLRDTMEIQTEIMRRYKKYWKL